MFYFFFQGARRCAQISICKCACGGRSSRDADKGYCRPVFMVRLKWRVRSAELCKGYIYSIRCKEYTEEPAVYHIFWRVACMTTDVVGEGSAGNTERVSHLSVCSTLITYTGNLKYRCSITTTTSATSLHPNRFPLTSMH